MMSTELIIHLVKHALTVAGFVTVTMVAGAVAGRVRVVA
jgi:hypothetical protein